MNLRATIGLLVVLGVLIGALLYSNQQQESQPAAKTEQPEVEMFAFSLEDARRLAIRAEGQTQVFVRDESGEWTVEAANQPANQRIVETVLLRLISSPATRRIPAAEADPNAFGLADPRLVAEIGTADGTIHTLRVGAQTPTQSGYYAQTAEGGDVYLIPAILVADLERLVRQPFAPTPTPVPSSGTSSAPPKPGPATPVP